LCAKLRWAGLAELWGLFLLERSAAAAAGC
jgi:hypothetical protein